MYSVYIVSIYHAYGLTDFSLVFFAESAICLLLVFCCYFTLFPRLTQLNVSTVFLQKFSHDSVVSRNCACQVQGSVNWSNLIISYYVFRVCFCLIGGMRIENVFCVLNMTCLFTVVNSLMLYNITFMQNTK